MRSRKKSPIKRIFALLFLVVAGVAAVYLFKKYSFTSERANLFEYLYVSGDEVAIFLNDEPKSQNEIEKDVRMRGLKSNDTVYLPLSFVKTFINNRS